MCDALNSQWNSEHTDIPLQWVIYSSGSLKSRISLLIGILHTIWSGDYSKLPSYKHLKCRKCRFHECKYRNWRWSTDFQACYYLKMAWDSAYSNHKLLAPPWHPCWGYSLRIPTHWLHHMVSTHLLTFSFSYATRADSGRQMVCSPQDICQKMSNRNKVLCAKFVLLQQINRLILFKYNIKFALITRI